LVTFALFAMTILAVVEAIRLSPGRRRESPPKGGVKRCG
jgi:hypothetical protein